MEPFIKITGIAAVLSLDNVDTDAIIPSSETQSVARTGYGERLFAGWRYLPGTRDKIADFVLNRSPFDQAQILVSGRNFGCGSSREAAVWALAQFGIRCVVAHSFGAIFRANCIRNGLLPVSLNSDAVERIQIGLLQDVQLTVDLEKSHVVCPDGSELPFHVESRDRQMLLAGVDEIALTLRKRKQIEEFRESDRRLRPWAYRPLL
jgi:3-isopropylmalate/(R)-2-methylmalate dehydratase small subunit